jgi:hypothetical protein
MLNVGQPHRALRFAGLELVSLGQLFDKMHWGFVVRIAEEDEEQGCSVYFDAGIYDPAGVRGLIDQFKICLMQYRERPICRSTNCSVFRPVNLGKGLGSAEKPNAPACWSGIAR